MNDKNLQNIAKETAEYAHNILAKEKEELPLDGDMTQILADKFLDELNLLNGNQNMISTKVLRLLDEGLEIDGYLVPQEIFDGEKHEYYPRDREDTIDNLTKWISETDSENDKQLMLDDLKYIMSHNDTLLLSSTSTNEYIFQSSEPESFDLICDELVALSRHSN